LGTVYKTLGRLEDKGYLRSSTSEPVAERGGRRKKLYQLSPSGLKAVQRSLADLRSLASGLDLELEQP
jgi:DNA-binding PadR family transcriptional regulator